MPDRVIAAYQGRCHNRLSMTNGGETTENGMSQPHWRVNNVAEVIVDAPVERVWAALTHAADTEQYFMRSRVTVGDVGEAYRVERDDGWRVDGVVLAKAPPHRLRVTWQIKTPSSLTMPNCEIEFVLAPAPAAEPDSAAPTFSPSTSHTPGLRARTRLTVREFVDGPVPPALANASRTGWSLITQNLKAYLA